MSQNNGKPPAYFVDHKRGEVNELKAMLSNPKLAKEADRKREVLKKVIAYMTLGIDVSKLFSEMVMAAYTRDVVQKKLIYLFLVNYAGQKSDLALLTINTLQKDCRDEDPTVRGLALRSLCSLRVPNLAEYVMIPLRNGLADQTPYVRKTAVMGIAKLAENHADVVRNSDLVDVLYSMLRDRDSNVISNVIQALNEVFVNEGGMAINTNIIHYLLSRVREFSEWGQCVVLELVARYKPTSDDEMYNIMNLLEDRLKHSNSAVVLSATKVLLNFTLENQPLQEEVYRRLKNPMLTLMGSSHHELCYSVLGHFRVLVQRAPHVFADSYKDFFCRFNDPSPVKQEKLDMITSLANDQNHGEVMAEVAEYVTDSDPEIGRFSIRSIGKIAVQVASATDEACEHLLSFLDLNLEHVTAETVVVLKDVLRKYPERYEDIIPQLHKVLKTIEETEGKVAVVWLIGEYGDTIDDAPYILEPLIDAYEEEEASAVRMELLSATAKLFFKRPPEVKAMLGRLLQAAINDVSHVDVRDRALLYYRLFKADVHTAAQVINCPKVEVDVFAEEQDETARNKILDEFNSLSPIYNLPSDRFVKKLGEAERRALEEAEAAEAAALAAAQQETSESGMLAGGGEAEYGLQLTPSFAIDKNTYAQSWGSFAVASTFELQLNLGAQLSSSALEGALASWYIMTFASGTTGPQIKLYLYAKDTASQALILVEALVNLANGQLTATVKSDNASVAPAFAQTFQQAIAHFM